MEAAQWREIIVSELKDAFRCGEVLQPVITEVSEFVAVQERSGRCGHQDLPAMAAGCDPGGSVHIDPDVALLSQMRRSGV